MRMERGKGAIERKGREGEKRKKGKKWTEGRKGRSGPQKPNSAARDSDAIYYIDIAKFWGRNVDDVAISAKVTLIHL